MINNFINDIKKVILKYKLIVVGRWIAFTSSIKASYRALLAKPEQTIPRGSSEKKPKAKKNAKKG